MEGEEQKVVEKTATQPKKGKKWLILAGVVLVVGIGATAYLVLAKRSDSGGNSQGILSSITPSKLNPNCKYNDPDLCKFINNWKDVDYLTMNGTDTDKTGKTTTSTFKLQGDDNSQMTMSEDGSEKYNTITIGKTTYTKDYTDNKWWKYTPAETEESLTDETESKIDFDTKAEEAEDKTTYEKIGTEACAKLTCFKYKVIDPANTESTDYIYFDNKDYQLRKSRSEYKDGNISEATYDYSKFSISAPSPVKEENRTSH